MNNKEHKEFTPEELEEIRAYAEQEAAAPDEYRFSNPDPYAKPEPAPEGQPRRFWFDAEGHIRVKNLSAFWLPELTLQREIGGTVYSVTVQQKHCPQVLQQTQPQPHFHRSHLKHPAFS